MNTSDMENKNSHYSNKWSRNPATTYDAADDERAFLKPFLAERREEVAWIFITPYLLWGKHTSESLLSCLREKYEHEPGVFYCYHSEITEENKAFDDQMYLAICKDPLAKAYAEYIVEYMAEVMLPKLFASYVPISRELPPTEAQDEELRALGIQKVLDYDRRTATLFIAQKKAANAREKTEWELRRLEAKETGQK